MAPTKSSYVFTFNPTSEEEEKGTAEALRILLCCRWTGSDFTKARNVSGTQESGGLQTVSYEWMQPKFFVGMAKVKEAIGSLSDRVQVYNLSDGVSLDDIMRFNELKSKYEVPDTLTDREEERNASASVYGKRAVSLPEAGVFCNSWMLGRPVQPVAPLPRSMGGQRVEPGV